MLLCRCWTKYITNNLNFSSPENEIGYWQLSSSCDGITEACIALGTPVTGGNVSLYNDSKNQNNEITPIKPTPVIGMVGKIDNVNKSINSKWKNINDQIWLVGSYSSESTLAASSYLEYFHGEITVDLQALICRWKILSEFLREAILENFANISHDVWWVVSLYRKLVFYLQKERWLHKILMIV